MKVPHASPKARVDWNERLVIDGDRRMPILQMFNGQQEPVKEPEDARLLLAGDADGVVSLDVLEHRL